MRAAGFWVLVGLAGVAAVDWRAALVVGVVLALIGRPRP